MFNKIKIYTILKPSIIIFSLFILILCSCSQDKSPKILSLREQFNQYYQEWKDETYLSIHSDTGWYISRPNFRQIVGLGTKIIPLIEEKLKEDKLSNGENGDFFLAYAVVEIYGWDIADFYTRGEIIGEQGFRDNVLKRLEEIKLKQ